MSGFTFEGRDFFSGCHASYRCIVGLNGHAVAQSVEVTAVLPITAGPFMGSSLVCFSSPLRQFGTFQAGVPALGPTSQKGATRLTVLSSAGTAATSACPCRKELWLPPNPLPVVPPQLLRSEYMSAPTAGACLTSSIPFVLIEVT